MNFTLGIPQSADNHDFSHQRRPYTVGVSIAVVVIFIIAIFHVWRYTLKKIKKYLNSNQVEDIIEIPSQREHEGRKISTSCIQQLDLFLQIEDEKYGINLVHTERKSRKSFSRDSKMLAKRHSMKSGKNSTSSKVQEICRQPKATFFAGYSHCHNSDN